MLDFNTGCRRMDKKRNIDIREEVNIFNLGDKVKEYKWKYNIF
jgi:hypothetical protein